MIEKLNNYIRSHWFRPLPNLFLSSMNILYTFHFSNPQIATTDLSGQFLPHVTKTILHCFSPRKSRNPNDL